jgi:hypothetical protein
MSQGMGGFRYWLYIWQVAVSLPRSGLLEHLLSQRRQKAAAREASVGLDKLTQ